MHYSVDTYMIVEEADVQCFRRLTVKYALQLGCLSFVTTVCACKV